MPSAAFTETFTVLDPELRVVPVTWNVASESLVTTRTDACVVLAGRVIVPPASALWPFTERISKPVFEAFLTDTEITYSLTEPLAAFTLTDRLFSPVRRPPLPITTAFAAESVGIATTSTERVPFATSIT